MIGGGGRHKSAERRIPVRRSWGLGAGPTDRRRLIAASAEVLEDQIEVALSDDAVAVHIFRAGRELAEMRLHPIDVGYVDHVVAISEQRPVFR